MTSLKGFQLLPARLEDVPALADISAASFETDAHTEVKSYGRSPFDMRAYSLSSLPSELANPRIRVIKAVEEGTGAIMGFCTWGFRGGDPPPLPPLGDDDLGEPNVGIKVVPEAETKEESRAQGGGGGGNGHGESATREESTEQVRVPKTKTETEAEEEKEKEEEKKDSDPIARLEALTSQDFKRWMEAIMPEPEKGNTKNNKPKVSCLFVIGLYVSPGFQRRGVGSALLSWGTDLVDLRGDDCFAWVHSSAGAWLVYEKAGFRTARTLDVDLDAYAPAAAVGRGREKGGRWGRYVFRYMVYGSLPEGVGAMPF